MELRKEDLLKLICEMTLDERAQIKALLDGGEQPTTEAEPSAETAETPVMEETAEQIAPPEAEEAKGIEGEVGTEEIPTVPTEIEKTAEGGELEGNMVDDEPIPSFSKPEQQSETMVEEATEEPLPETAPPLQDNDGADLPIDYGQIVEGLNAKILALQTENSKLKAKTEGAFGLSSKPGEYARVNSLYDNDTSNLHFKK